MKKTKIVCTLGPASDTKEILRELIINGMNVARLNFSHGSHEEHAARIKRIKEVRKELGIPIAIMLDTKGPEIRTGDLENEKVELVTGENVTLTTEPISGDQKHFSVSYKNLPKEVSAGCRILIDDGLIQLEVENTNETEINCRVLNGGTLGSKKSINIPGVNIELPALTEKDKSDIIFGIQQKVDYVAASFVRKPHDVLAIRKVLEQNGGGGIYIISKIENQEGVENIDRILDVSDGIMVARGDLGVEIPAEEVPLVQKSIIRKCNLLGKPVITATQMLDSMMRNPRPTRAEVGDVANAVFDGTDAVMLSGETAAGSYPIESVKTMCNIVVNSEDSEEYARRKKPDHGELTITNAVSEGACQIADQLDAQSIIAATSSGHTARMISKYRPDCGILAVTDKVTTVRRLSLVWGVNCIYTAEFGDTDSMIQDAVKKAVEQDYVKFGDIAIVAAGVPLGVQGNTNMIKVHTVGNAIINGVGIGKNPVTGYAKLVTSANIGDFQEGDILVVKALTPEVNSILPLASAIITEEGGLSSEGAIAGLHYDIPVIVNVVKALETLEHGKLISVDPKRGVVYQGRVQMM
ncbi:pyruvate kinase [Acetobacterium woodii]|uniref:Pyruvate kinase n=1 Tax=Acetobacterium woodii (strain ATCC 29683 / DSM 1030 / JCM 2381 / KCTC 1655 / WB1) TaxID=931626 RepID=H6LEG1_ACEWD|nr:pyruvate kinase [Acetobacterium woodii]AFA48064.1 pyruvate kinase Pyk [Acetobacterium woodii DSM 1030]